MDKDFDEALKASSGRRRKRKDIVCLPNCAIFVYDACKLHMLTVE